MSPGFARGEVFAYRAYLPVLTEEAIRPAAVPDEVHRFRTAVSSAQAELRGLHTQVKHSVGRDLAEFIDVQLALLSDQEVLAETERVISEKLRNAEFAYTEALKRLAAPIGRSAVPLFQERALDVVDVSSRVLRHLLGDESPSLHGIERGAVLVAHDLPPSHAALLDPRKVAGIVLEGGGKTSHTAIMAKTKEIPAVVGVEGIGRVAQDGQTVIVDGYRGLAILNPTRRRIGAYDGEVEVRRRHRQSLTRLAEQEPVTLDGKMIDLSANIEFAAEARAAVGYGARGVGLFRTEYIYLSRRRPPTESEQFEAFAEVAEVVRPHPVIIRTFDLGGDKVIPGYVESNPFLGWRGLRLCLDNQELFRSQVRAILRASGTGNVKMMFPMVSSIEELRRAKLLVNRMKQELRRERVKFDESIEVGVMVETPSAALLAPRFARECSFLSIGSNDLTQYTLAVDRANERVAGLYDPFHPAVLGLIRMTIDAAHQEGIWVGLCGEFASEPLGILVLLGLRIDELSVAPGAIPEAKKVIRSIDTGSAVEIMTAAMRLGTALEVKRLLRRELHRRFPKLAAFLFEFAGDESQ